MRQAPCVWPTANANGQAPWAATAPCRGPMRGMEWMWGPNAGATLPDAESPAAKLFVSYCRQCHSPPSPTLHTRAEWQQTIQRMRGHIASQSGPMDTGVLVPSAEEFEALSQYLGDHAAEEP